MQVILRICTQREVHFLRWGGVDLTIYKMGGGEGASSSPSLGLFGQHDFRQRPVSGVRPKQPCQAALFCFQAFASSTQHCHNNSCRAKSGSHSESWAPSKYSFCLFWAHPFDFGLLWNVPTLLVSTPALLLLFGF